MENQKLISIGYLKSYIKNDLPNPLNFIDENVDQYQRNDLIEYLEKGKIQVVWRGYSECRLCDIEHEEIGHACLTDGKYIWPEGLSHYIKVHKVWLPQEFIDHAVANQAKTWDDLVVNESILYGDFT